MNNTKTMTFRKKALFLSYFTVGYNVLEGIVSVFAGVLAGSIALIGFGLDSFVESLSGGIMVWRFSGCRDMSGEEEEKIEKKAIRLIAYTFFIFSAYILYESLRKLYIHEPPEPTLLGIVIAVISVLVMPVLFYMKQKTGRAMGSKSLMADSKQTLACIFLSLSLLIGLGANYLFGIWWADPAVGLVVVIFLMREGYEALRKDKLCSC